MAAAIKPVGAIKEPERKEKSCLDHEYEWATCKRRENAVNRDNSFLR